MTHNDIAREAADAIIHGDFGPGKLTIVGLTDITDITNGWKVVVDRLHSIVLAAIEQGVAEEREACAKVVEQWAKDEKTASSFGADNYSYTALDDCAAAIRERKGTT